MHQILKIFLTALLLITATPSWAELDGRAVAQISVLCEQLLADYAIYRDHLDADGFANTFASDGALIVGSGTHRGREQIHKYITDHTMPGNAHMIMFTTTDIEVHSETQASGLSYAVILGGDRPVLKGDNPIQVEGMAAANEYYSKFILTDEGWKISEISLKTMFRGPRD